MRKNKKLTFLYLAFIAFIGFWIINLCSSLDFNSSKILTLSGGIIFLFFSLILSLLHLYFLYRDYKDISLMKQELILFSVSWILIFISIGYSWHIFITLIPETLTNKSTTGEWIPPTALQNTKISAAQWLVIVTTSIVVVAYGYLLHREYKYTLNLENEKQELILQKEHEEKYNQ